MMQNPSEKEYSPFIYFKLVSGEDLVGEIVSDTPDSIVFKNMLLINFVPNERGQVGVQMLQFPLLVEDGDEITIMKSAITLKARPNEDFMNSYRQRFGHIQIVQKPGIFTM